eukprot:scaffold95921_cov58-Phaeocystis_antarctica.AAC.3
MSGWSNVWDSHLGRAREGGAHLIQLAHLCSAQDSPRREDGCGIQAGLQYQNLLMLFCWQGDADEHLLERHATLEPRAGEAALAARRVIRQRAQEGRAAVRQCHRPAQRCDLLIGPEA